MRLIFSFSLLTLAAMLVAGCSDSNPANPSGSPSGNNGNGSYWPTSKGSFWTYTGNLTYTVTVMNDTVVNGKTYTIMANSQPGVANGLFRHEGDSYYSTDLQASKETLFLKDGGVGTKWSFDVTANGTPNHHEYTIEQTGITHVVNGKTYTDVMRIHSKASFVNPITGDPFVFNEGSLYYAKNVGLIQTDYGQLGIVNLIAYEIK